MTELKNYDQAVRYFTFLHAMKQLVSKEILITMVTMVMVM